MKQFARCANCCKWYVHAFTQPVEIYQGAQLQRLAVWCYRCIVDAEHRSQPGDNQHNTPSLSHASIAPPTPAPACQESGPESVELLVQEHLQLMDRAMHEEDTVLVPLIEDFMQRCQSYHDDLQPHEQAQRLRGHLQYWEAFLKALQQSL
jgi:hypothetical protein